MQRTWLALALWACSSPDAEDPPDTGRLLHVLKPTMPSHAVDAGAPAVDAGEGDEPHMCPPWCPVGNAPPHQNM
jgi:hypothetical protein